MPDNRGAGRLLQVDDFGPGKITQFSRQQIGPEWNRSSALAAYRLNDFIGRVLPFRATITSAWRSPAQNSAAGGAANSRHLYGDAFDVIILDPNFFSRSRYYRDLALAAGFTGVGLYDSERLIHLDTRPGPVAQWAKVGGGFGAIEDYLARVSGPLSGGAGAGVVVALLALWLITQG